MPACKPARRSWLEGGEGRVWGGRGAGRVGACDSTQRESYVRRGAEASLRAAQRGAGVDSGAALARRGCLSEVGGAPGTRGRGA